MIDFMPDWLEWVFLISGIVFWCGVGTAIVVLICEDSID